MLINLCAAVFPLGLIIPISVIVFLVVFVLLTAYILYRKIFFCHTKQKHKTFELPQGEEYEEYRQQLFDQVNTVKSIPYEEVQITSRDGLKLCGKYYAIESGAPLEILVHGYQGTPELDCGGALLQCVKRRHNAILIDHRAHGKSEGKSISFGVNERYDVMRWVDYAINRFGKQTQILLVGVSMGAATVLMTADLGLPSNVVGIVADSSYTAPNEILREVIGQRGYSRALVYPLVVLAARIFGKFDVKGGSARQALKQCKVPVLLVHGEDDHFVPCAMSKENYEACPSEKLLLIVPKAGHGLSYFVDNDAYQKAITKFENLVFADSQKVS